MAAPEQHLDLDSTFSAAAPQLGHEVPSSLGALLDHHGVDPALDSRRHLRRPRWSRIAGLCHALGAGLLTAGALFTTLQHSASAMLAAAIAITGSAVILMSHTTRPGRHALRELVTVTIAALSVNWFTAMHPLNIEFVPGMTLAAWHVLAGIAALGCALVVISGMAQAPQAFPRTVRFCAGMIGVFTAAALAV